MRASTSIASIASCTALAATLSACTVSRTVALDAPTVPAVVAVPAPAVVPAPVVTPVAALEYGRVTNIEYFPGGTAASRINVPGAIVGGVAGAVIGNQVGRAVGDRNPATILGGVAGAAIGSQTGTTVVNTLYRVSIQTDTGMFRIYDVPATGDLRVGDRVRVENGVIYRS